MAVLTVIELAKTMFIFNENIENKIEDALPLATRELRARLLSPVFMRYMNSEEVVVINSFAEDLDDSSRTICAVDNIYPIQEFDLISISDTTNYDGYYEVLLIDTDNNTFTITKVFSSTETGNVRNEDISVIKTAHAWLILYYITQTLQELSKGKVLLSSEEFGDGNTRTYGQDEIRLLREQYLKNVETLIGSVNSKFGIGIPDGK